MPGASESAALASPIGYRIRPYTIPKEEPPAVQVVREAGRGVAELAHGMTEPEMLPLAPLAAVPVGRAGSALRHVIPKAMGILFGGQAAGAGAGEIVAGIEQEDPRLIGRGIPQVGMGVGMAGPAIKFPRSIQALRQEPRVVAPENLPVIPEQPLAKEVTSAPVQERPATEILQNVRKEPVEGAQEMPTPSSLERVLGSVETQAQPEVPLKPAEPPKPATRSFQERFPVGADVNYEPPGAASGTTRRESGKVIGYRQDPTTGSTFAEIELASGRKEFAGDINDIRAVEPLTPEEQALAQSQLEAEEPGIAGVEKPTAPKTELDKKIEDVRQRLAAIDAAINPKPSEVVPPAKPTAVPATKPAPEPTSPDVTTGAGEALPPIQRKSPTVGTPEREAIESAFDAADAKRTEAYEKALKAKEERDKMGRFTQARDRKDKQVERLEEAYQKVKTVTEDVIQRGIQAHREDRAGAINPLAAIDAREQLKLISSNDAYNLKMRLLMEEGRRQGLSPEEAKSVANEAITFTAFKPEETLSSIVEYRTGRTRFETVKREAQREMDTVLEESRGTYPRSSVPEARVRRAMENAHDKSGVDKALAEAKELAK